MDIETIKTLARDANMQGKQDVVAFCLSYLENLLPVGIGKRDAFVTFCSELERDYYERRA